MLKERKQRFKLNTRLSSLDEQCTPDQHHVLLVCLFVVFYGTLQLMGYGVPGQNVGWFIIPVSLFVLCRSG